MTTTRGCGRSDDEPAARRCPSRQIRRPPAAWRFAVWVVVRARRASCTASYHSRCAERCVDRSTPSCMPNHSRKAPMERFVIVNLLELDDSVSGRVEGLEGRFARTQLDSRDLGVSHFRYAPNLRAFIRTPSSRAGGGVRGHRRGGADSSRRRGYIELRRWDVVRVAPDVVRAFAAGPDGLELIAIGGPNRKAATARCLRSSGRSDVRGAGRASRATLVLVPSSPSPSRHPSWPRRAPARGSHGEHGPRPLCCRIALSSCSSLSAGAGSVPGPAGRLARPSSTSCR